MIQAQGFSGDCYVTRTANWRTGWSSGVCFQDYSCRARCWKETTAPNLTGPSKDCCSVFITWWDGFPQNTRLSREQGRSHNILSDIASEVTHCHCHNVPLVAQVVPSQCVKGLHQGVDTRRQRSLGVIFRPATILSKEFIISDIVFFMFSISSWFIFIASISLLKLAITSCLLFTFPTWMLQHLDCRYF